YNHDSSPSLGRKRHDHHGTCHCARPCCHLDCSSVFLPDTETPWKHRDLNPCKDIGDACRCHCSKYRCRWQHRSAPGLWDDLFILTECKVKSMIPIWDERDWQ